MNYFDRFNREPVSLLVKLFGMGMLTPLPAVIVEYIALPLISRLPPGQAVPLQAFLGIAVPEEGVKLLVLLWFINKSRDFDEILDGAVYAVAISMGFAVCENFLYVLNSSNPLAIALMRSFTAIPLHALAAGYMGLAIARSKLEKEGRIFLSYLVAVLIHGSYDYILMEPRIPSVLAVLLLVVLWPLLIKKIRKARIDDFRAGRFFHYDKG
jgi:RsiW-degrading membrane proteinase PrsW (M82 family)